MNLTKFVTYVKQTWANSPKTTTPLSAARLGNMETGIKNNNNAISELAAAVVSELVNSADKIPSMAALYAVNKTLSDFKGERNIATYTSLSQLGLSDADMSATDFEANIVKIFEVLPTRAVLAPSMSTNMITSLRAKLNSDLGMEIETATPLMIITRFGSTTAPAKIEVILDSIAYEQIFTARYDVKDEVPYLSKFAESYHPDGFVKRKDPKGELLWRNPSVSEEFAGQSIEMGNIKDYTMFVVFCNLNTSSVRKVSMIVLKGWSGEIQRVGNYTSTGEAPVSTRNVSFSSSEGKITFTDVTKKTGSTVETDNAQLIPYSIYGIR